MVHLSDASFANDVGLKSQLGLVINMQNELENDSTVNLISNRCIRRTGSGRKEEVHTLILVVHHKYVNCKLLVKLTKQCNIIEAFAHGNTLHITIAMSNTTGEKRLQIDVCVLKESYNIRKSIKKWMDCGNVESCSCVKNGKIIQVHDNLEADSHEPDERAANCRGVEKICVSVGHTKINFSLLEKRSSN